MILLERGSALLAAGRPAEALEALRAVPLASLAPTDADLARVRLARALVARGRAAEGRALLQKVPEGSPHAAEAAFHLARDRARRTRAADAYESVADRFPGTPWGEEALLSLANHYQKDALDDAALPWWRRLVAEYPQGRYVERAAWRAGWADYRARRYAAAAQTLETTARLRPPSGSTAGFLYWSARARLGTGPGRPRAAAARGDRAALQARLPRRPGPRGARPPRRRPHPTARRSSPRRPRRSPSFRSPTRAARAQLLLIERLDEAARELRRLPESSRVQATLAWIDWRQGRYRPAITAMKRAYPEWVGEAGDRLPREVWQILFPLRYDAELRRAAQRGGRSTPRSWPRSSSRSRPSTRRR